MWHDLLASKLQQFLCHGQEIMTLWHDRSITNQPLPPMERSCNTLEPAVRREPRDEETAGLLEILAMAPLNLTKDEPTWRCRQNPFIGALMLNQGPLEVKKIRSQDKSLEKSSWKQRLGESRKKRMKMTWFPSLWRCYTVVSGELLSFVKIFVIQKQQLTTGSQRVTKEEL